MSIQGQVDFENTYSAGLEDSDIAQTWLSYGEGGDSELLSLNALGLLRRYVNERIEVGVKASVAEGASWDDIGNALGVSRQAAWERYRRITGES